MSSNNNQRKTRKTGKLIMMIGIPGSGKSTYAKYIANKINAEIISTDSIRKEICGDEMIQISNKIVFQKAINRINNCLLKGENVVYDAVNTKKGFPELNILGRDAMLEKICDCEHMAVYIDVTLETARKRNAARDRVMPDKVLIDNLNALTIPDDYENFNQVIVINNNEGKPNFTAIDDISL